MTYFIGVDPGKSGGIAIIDRGSDEALQYVYVTPMIIAGKYIDVMATADWIEQIIGEWSDDVIACIEKVGAMPKQGVTSMFNFGFSTGIIHGIIGAWGISLYEVPPQTWKSEVLAGTSKDKAAAIDYCRRAYPQVDLLATPRSRKPHSGMADALCIAIYASVKY